jgi:uncharacterized protein YodC (DUF2158 family)
LTSGFLASRGKLTAGWNNAKFFIVGFDKRRANKMSSIEAGTIVQLKSGGPKMTADKGPDKNGYVDCRWFSGSKLEYGRFPLSSLILFEEPEGKKK